MARSSGAFRRLESVYQRFNRWAKSGVFERIFKALARDHDNEYMMIRCTIVGRTNIALGAQKKDGEQAIGRSRGRTDDQNPRPRDALGNPVELMLTPGQAHDLDLCGSLLKASTRRPCLATRHTTQIR